MSRRKVANDVSDSYAKQRDVVFTLTTTSDSGVSKNLVVQFVRRSSGTTTALLTNAVKFVAETVGMDYDDVLKNASIVGESHQYLEILIPSSSIKYAVVIEAVDDKGSPVVSCSFCGLSSGHVPLCRGGRRTAAKMDITSVFNR